jgi:hypothetical protein
LFEISHDPLRGFHKALHEGRRLVQQRLFAGGTIRRTQFGLEGPGSGIRTGTAGGVGLKGSETEVSPQVTLYQMGGTEFSELYILGQSVLQPALANILIENGWVVPGDKHWVEAVIAYRLSTAGLDIEQQLEAWWGKLTLDQRLRAALLE